MALLVATFFLVQILDMVHEEDFSKSGTLAFLHSFVVVLNFMRCWRAYDVCAVPVDGM